MRTIPQTLTKEFMINYLGENDPIALVSWEEEEKVSPDHGHVYRELMLIVQELEKEIDFGTVKTFSCEDGIIGFPDIFTHRLGQRFYKLTIVQLEHFKAEHPDIVKECFDSVPIPYNILTRGYQ